MSTPDSTFVSERLSPHVMRVPVPTLTLPPATETNTYLILGNGEAAIVDLGSASPEALEAVTACLRHACVSRVTALIATHYHRDHVDGLPALAARLAQVDTAPPLYMHPLDIDRLSPRGVLWHSAPEHLCVGGVQVRLLHAPGHTHGHLHVWIPEDRVILVGDHLSGDGTVWIGPPDGHMTLYLETLDRLAGMDVGTAGPGHGAPLSNAPAAATALKQRRLLRERQILTHLSAGPSTVEALTAAVYQDTLAPGAELVARRSVQAHLLRLLELRQVTRLWDPAQRRFVYRTSTV